MNETEKLKADIFLRMEDSLTDAQKSKAALLGQLKKSQEELKVALECQGACDHSVNICSCDLIRLIEENADVIVRAEAVQS